MGLWRLLAAGPAVAQSSPSPNPGFPAERLTPAVGPTAFSQVEGGRVPAAGQVYVVASAQAIYRPVVLRSTLSDVEAAVPVEYHTGLDLAAEFGVWRQRLSVGVGLPVTTWQRGDRLTRTGSSEPSAFDTARPLAPLALGDLRFRGKALLTAPDRPTDLAVIVELTAPGGGQQDFAATSSFTFSPRLAGSLRQRVFIGAAQVGVRFAPQRWLYETTLHHLLEWGAAAGFRLPVRRVGLGLYVETAGVLNLVSDSKLLGVELRGGVRIGWLRGALDLGGGGGLGSLSPGWRASAQLRFFWDTTPAAVCPARALTWD